MRQLKSQQELARKSQQEQNLDKNVRHPSILREHRSRETLDEFNPWRQRLSLILA